MLEKLTQKQKQQFEQFAKILQAENEKINLTGITEPDQIRQRHFEDSLVVFERIKQIGRNFARPVLVDIGSGAGFPSLALAIVLEDWKIVSVESTGKKADFQRLVISELGLENVEVIGARAEEIGRVALYREKCDVVTVRALGVLALIAELGMPLLKVGGCFFAWKGPKLDQELAAGESMLKILGAGEIKQWPYSLPKQNVPTAFRIIEAVKSRPTPRAYPRSFKDIKKSIN